MRFLITGVGKGFGRAYIGHLSGIKNIKILAITRTLSDFSKKELNSLEKKNIEVVQVDLSQNNDLQKFIKKYSTELENTDVLINNAGQRYRKSIENIEWNELETLFKVNVFSQFILSKAVVPGMKKRKSGKIINLSSILGKAGLKDLSGYSATKGAVDSFTKSLAIELASYGVSVNAIAPGFCETSYFENFKKNEELFKEITDKIPMKRWGGIDELHSLLDFLIFKKSDYLTGQTIYIDGGWTAQ